MGECSDFYEGEGVVVTVEFDAPHRMALTGTVTWTWEDFVDVGLGDTVLRFPRGAFDCSNLEGGGPCSVMVEDFDQHFARVDYDPEEEASDVE